MAIDISYKVYVFMDLVEASKNLGLKSKQIDLKLLGNLPNQVSKTMEYPLKFGLFLSNYYKFDF